MANYKTAKNILSSRTEYSRIYGGFRGVDFSNDHTQVNDSRFAYLVNMYKDYQSGQGEAVETIAGFRRRCDFSLSIKESNGVVTNTTENISERGIYGIHYCKFENNGQTTLHVLIHSGSGLYKWVNYPNSIGVVHEKTIVVPSASDTVSTGDVVIRTFSQELNFPCGVICSLKTASGSDLTHNATYNKTTQTITYVSSEVDKDDILSITYYEDVLLTNNLSNMRLISSMNKKKSTSFIFNNRLYIIDGKNYLVYDGNAVAAVKNSAYIPTTYIGIVPSGENANIGIEYEQRNVLTPKFKHTFVADGTTTEFYMNENNLDSIVTVKVYGETKATTDYSVDLASGKIIFSSAPAAPENSGFEQGYAGVEITASKVYTSIDGVTQNMTDVSELISKCTLCTTYDGRVFCTGNPDYPNHVFFCARNNTGYADPSYFGILNYMQDGVGLAPITGIMCVSDTLMILKSDTQQDSSIYFHTATDSNIHLMPRIYPSVQGLSGLGCLGSCCNFLDDPVFLSRLGVEGVSQLKVASERSNEHRSRLVDAKLLNTDLRSACMEEWGGYLCILTDGKIFLADSRQRYQDSTGAMQYEWYYLENIGVYPNQYKEYKYASAIPTELVGVKIMHNGVEYDIELAEKVFYSYENQTKNLCGTAANAPNEEGESDVVINSQILTVTVNDYQIKINVDYVAHEIRDIYTDEVIETHIYLCETKGCYTGGQFKKAQILKSMDDNLFFGCENGTVCSFNFDKRGPEGEMPPTTYSFDNRTIFCGCATLMDNCKIPHLTKSTIKRSTVIKTKSFKNSSAKIKVRTNKKPYEQIARINSNIFSFEDLDFSDLSFETADQSLFAVKEKEKQWVEKQYYLYSDEYLKPFALYYITFRYYVAGRFKN